MRQDYLILENLFYIIKNNKLEDHNGLTFIVSLSLQKQCMAAAPWIINKITGEDF